MNKRATRFLTLALVLSGGMAHAAYFDTGFDGYLEGTTFTSPQDGWAANTSAVVLTSAEAYSPALSVLVPGPAILSNTVSVVAPSNTWTEFRIKPVLKTPDPYTPPTASFVQYFNLEGYAVVLTTGGVWRTCTNDVWGDPVDPVSSTNWVDVAVFQNYDRGYQALFVNDRLLVQDLPFASASSNYNRLVVNTLFHSTYLDDVRVRTTFEPGRLTNDLNGNAIADATEMETYGYCGRTFRVGAGEDFTSLQAAVNVYRALDTLLVIDSSFNEDLTVTGAVVFSGAVFTNSGSLTVASGGSVTFTTSSVWNSMDCTGAVIIAGSDALRLDSLAMGAAGTVASTAGRLVVASSSVDLTGPFTVSGSTWGQAAVVPLPFQDTFESYSDGMTLQAADFRGWGASDTSIVVQAAAGAANSKAAIIPGGEWLSNRVSSAATTVWTEFYGRLSRGYALNNMPTGSSAFVSCLDTNGYLNVWMSNTWNVCSNDALGQPIDPVDTNTFVRVDVFTDYTTHRYALFLDGVLLREQAPFPSLSVGSFSRLIVRNDDPRTSTRVDDVTIDSVLPGGLTNDADGDSAADAMEISSLGSIFIVNQWSTGSIYIFR